MEKLYLIWLVAVDYVSYKRSGVYINETTGQITEMDGGRYIKRPTPAELANTVKQGEADLYQALLSKLGFKRIYSTGGVKAIIYDRKDNLKKYYHQFVLDVPQHMTYESFKQLLRKKFLEFSKDAFDKQNKGKITFSRTTL